MQPPDESLLRYPCTISIKALGIAADGFESAVFDIVSRHVSGLSSDSVGRRASRGGKYLSVTVTITASSRQQLDAIYRDLTACEQVMTAL